MKLTASTRRVCRDILLIALAIQAVTPDSRDLSSSRLIQLISRNKSAVQESAEQVPPLPFEIHPDASNEVCEPATRNASPRIHFVRIDRMNPDFTWPNPDQQGPPATPAACPVQCAAIRVSHDLLSSLCRLLF
jgi:hypothetical protein